MQVTPIPASATKVWPHYIGHTDTREEVAAYIKSTQAFHWPTKSGRPEGITLHNTDLPDLPMWVEWGAKHDQRLVNMIDFFIKVDRFTHGGPHVFTSRENFTVMTDFAYRGTHSRCWNGNRIAIEMVGNFEKDTAKRKGDAFDTGDGAKVRDNSVFLIARLNEKFGFKPADLTFHRECKLDSHACPGSLVTKKNVVDRVLAEMGMKVADASAPMKAPPKGG